MKEGQEHHVVSGVTENKGVAEKQPIAFDDETTWPPAVMDLLEASVAEFSEVHAQLVSSIDALIRDQEIIGYHCTRLADDEIAFVEGEGLRPLTEELRQSRVRRRVEAGDLSPDMAVRLLRVGTTGDNRHRLGSIYFYFTKEVGSWCWKFFRYWGGESIYVPHMGSDGAERDKLRSMGIPCIIEIAVPVSALSDHSAAHGLLYEFGRRRNIPLRQATHDVVREPVRVLRVVQYGSSEFTSRTRDISWFEPIYP